MQNYKRRYLAIAIYIYALQAILDISLDTHRLHFNMHTDWYKNLKAHRL